jgi:hypothetical protein
MIYLPFCGPLLLLVYSPQAGGAVVGCLWFALHRLWRKLETGFLLNTQQLISQD